MDNRNVMGRAGAPDPAVPMPALGAKPRVGELKSATSPFLGARVQPSDFARLKDHLARLRKLGPEARDAVRLVPPTELYALAPLLGLSPWALLEEVGAFLNLQCRESLRGTTFATSGLSIPFCRARLMLPIGTGSDISGFAISNPFDLDCVDIVTGALGPDAFAAVYLVLPSVIQSRLDASDGDQTPPVALTRMADLARTVEAEVENSPDAESDLFDVDQLARISQLPTVVQAVNMIIANAVKAGASDIHLEPKATDLLVRFRVDGVLADAIVLPHQVRSSVISRLKIIGHLDIAERRRPQDGRARLRFGDQRVDMRISTLPSQFGEKIVIRILSSAGEPIALDELSLSPKNLAALQRVLLAPQGLLIVTGPTGSGKSTTLYAAVNYLKSPTKNVVTIEDPIEFQIAGVTQVQVQTKSGVTFAAVLRSVLRQDPNIIMVGEVRDQETAEIAVEAALTGHLMLTTLHTNDAVSCITRLIDLGIEPYQLTSSLSAVVAQRLVRRLCPVCAIAAVPPLEALERLGLSGSELAHGTWREAAGCPECRHTGYKGRIAVHEVLDVSAQIRQLIATRASEQDLRDTAVRLGMVPMLHDGLAKAAAGLTTLDELLRVVPPPPAGVSVRPVAVPDQRVDETALEAPLSPARQLAEPHPELQPQPPAPAPVAEASPAVFTDPRKVVLVIEDDWSMQALERLCLTKAGYDVEVVADGIEALLALGRRPFDLILSDINMPNMDGITLLQFTKQKGIKTPVVFLSADAAADREQQCRALGATDYITKPFTLAVLLQRVQQALA